MQYFTNEEISRINQSEISILKMLWQSDMPLARQHIMRKVDEEKLGWKPTYVTPLLKTMLEKGLIEVKGTIHTGRRHARLFSPVLSRERYQQYLFEEFYPDEMPSSEFIAQLVRPRKNKEKYLEALKMQIEALQAELDK